MESDPVETLENRHRPVKDWGWEEWIVNNEMYCGKRLHFTKAFGHTSLHFHMNKHETMYVEKGTFEITVVNKVTTKRTHHILLTGQSMVIEPGTVHRITALDQSNDAIFTEAVLLEFSTHHEDSDSYRVER